MHQPQHSQSTLLLSAVHKKFDVVSLKILACHIVPHMQYYHKVLSSFDILRCEYFFGNSLVLFLVSKTAKLWNSLEESLK